MSNIILLFLCMLIGIALRRYGRVPDNAHAAINGFIINVSLPALTLLQIHDIHLHPTLAYAVAMPWLLFTIAAMFFWSISKLLQFSPATTGCLILVAGLGNTSFVGLPMIETFYGTGGMSVGILIDQLGTYLVLSTLGIAVGAQQADIDQHHQRRPKQELESDPDRQWQLDAADLIEPKLQADRDQRERRQRVAETVQHRDQPVRVGDRQQQ